MLSPLKRLGEAERAQGHYEAAREAYALCLQQYEMEDDKAKVTAMRLCLDEIAEQSGKREPG